MLRKIFPHVYIAGVDDLTLMDDAIHNRVRYDAAAKPWMPFALLVLGAKDGRPLVVSFLKNLQQILAFPFGRGVKQPFINNQQVVVGESFVAGRWGAGWPLLPAPAAATYRRLQVGS